MNEAGNNRSIQIQESAVGSAIVSGDGNTIYVIQQSTEQKRVEPEPQGATEIGPNPYKGLAAFKESDADRYYGREAQIERLWQRFQSLYAQSDVPRFLPILGPSGCGKSSLARAGFIPELARNPLPGKAHMRVAVLVPGARPLEALAGVLAKAVTDDPFPVEKAEEFERVLKKTNDVGECEGLRRIANMIPDIRDTPLVILVDQFEEVYSLCKEPEQRQAFINNLLHAASEPTGEVSVVITLRSDFLGETQRQEQLNQVIGSDQSAFVPAMTMAELRRAIAEPAKQAGRPLDDATIDLLVQDTKGREGALPLLQFALARIWDGLSQGKTPATTYREMGGVGGALAGEAQKTYDRLSDAEKNIAQRVFVGLVQLGEGTRDTRRRTLVKGLIAKQDAPDAVQQVIRQFSASTARLITLSSADGQDIAEVTHEALFEHWQQLNEWLDNSRDDIRFQRRLEAAAVYWEEQGCPDGSLWRRPDLDLMKSYHQKAKREMTPLQLRFFRASIRAAQRRKVLSSVGVGALVVLSGITSLLTIRAQRTQRESFASQLATKSEWIGSQSSVLRTTSALLAVKASKTFTDELNAPLEVDQALRSSLKLLPVSKGQFDHEGEVNAVSFSPDGKTFATASDDNTARIWDAHQTRGPIATLNHEGEVNAASFSPDGKTIATASEDNTARIWNAKTGEEIATLNHERSVRAASFSPDGKTIATASWDNTARIWNAKTGEEIVTLNHEESINAVSYSPDGKTIATASYDNTARIWNVETGEEIATLNHESSVLAASFSPDGNTLATASWDNTARIWNAKTGEEIATLNHKSEVWTASFSPDGNTLATASRDSTARLWDATTGEEIATFNHAGSVLAASFSPDGNTLATTSADNTARIWNVQTGEEIATLSHEDSVIAASYSPNGKTIVTASGDNTARIWNAETGKEIATLNHEDLVLAASYSPDGNTLATASWDSTARIWNVQTGKEIATLNHEGAVFAVSFSPDGNTLATASIDRTARIWNAKTGEEIATLNHEGKVIAASFSPDGNTLATTSADNTARLWNAKTGEEIATLNEKAANPPNLQSLNIAVSFSPDGNTLATTSADNTARIWNVQTGEEIATLSHEDSVIAASYSPNGKTIVTASGDNTARIWNAETGKEIATLNHEDSVIAASYSPDGNTLVTASGDNTARIWNAETGEGIATLNHENRVLAASYSPDSKTIVTASDDNTARIWHRSYGVLAANVCERISRNLTAFEWSTYLKTELTQYELICDNRPVHPSVLAKAKQYAQSEARSDRSKAISILRRVQALEPDIDLDPTTDIKEQDPKAVARNFFQVARATDKVQEGNRLAEEGKIEEAILLYQNAQNLSPDIDLDPDTETQDTDPQEIALKVSAAGKLEEAERLATQGKVTEAISLYKEAQSLSPDIDLDPDTATQDTDPQEIALKVSAAGKLEEAERLATQGKVTEAISLYKEAQELIEIPAHQWQLLCFYGSKQRRAADVIFACERAVELEPENLDSRFIRGFARALTRDQDGAIADFQTLADKAEGPEAAAPWQELIKRLSTGQDSVIDEVLESLYEVLESS